MEDFDIGSIGRKSVASIIALMSRQFLLNIISLAASLVIFTILAPLEVGIYTAVVAIQRIISFFTDFGFGAALVQKKDSLIEDDIKTTFTIQLLVSVLIILLTTVFMNPIVSYFNLGSVAPYLLLALVFSMFTSSFKVIPSILLERKIEFQKLIIPQVVESLTFNIILVALVLRGFHLYSYVWAFLISSVISIPLYYFVSPWKISLGISKASLSHLKFGLQFQAKNILATIKDDLLTVILVKFISLTELGYIGFAQKLSFFAYRYIVDSVTKVTFSAYSRMQNDKELLRKGIEKSLFFVSAIMFPIMVGIIISGPYIIRHVQPWNQKWEPAIISLIFFSLNATISSLSGILVNVLDSNGKVKSTLSLMAGWTVMTWIITPIAIYLWGFNGVAIASFLVTLTIAITISMAKKVVHFDLLRSVYKPIVGTIFMAAFLFLGTRFFASNLTTLIAVCLIAGAIYVVILYMMAKDELQHDLSKILLKKT